MMDVAICFPPLLVYNQPSLRLEIWKGRAMRRWLWIGLCLWASMSVVQAQDEALIFSEARLDNTVDVYGQTVLVAEGSASNSSSTTAYGSISLQAVAYDASGAEVGEGIGYVVNACGAALTDFALQPGAAQPYAIPLELYEDGVTVSRVEITADSTAVDPAPRALPLLTPGLTQAVEGEVVNVEWIDETNLRYAEGCNRDLFVDWTWREYNLRTGLKKPTTHPKVEFVTEALRRQLGLLEPLYFQHSLLSFAPDSRRMVYQNELNSVITAEPDGSFKRNLFDKLSDRTLQGITWLGKGVFLAYYYGATGDPVTYFTASVDGQTISEAPKDTIPSLITPGASPDGKFIVIGAEVDGKTGYYLKRAAFDTNTLLFESPLPPNNWPGPLFEIDGDGASFIYAAVQGADGAHLVCYNRPQQKLYDLSPLPLQLASDERAWWWFSPDKNNIALAANGLHGGLWIIDLAALAACE